MEDPRIQLARQAIQHYLENSEYLDLPADLPETLTQQAAGAFVSLKTSAGELRGCIGTFLPTKANLGLEIINNAVHAATQDPRFMAVELEELADLKISVDVLSEPEPTTREELDPHQFGIIVKADDGRSGLLLPDLEGVDTVDQQVEITCQKAGINPKEEFNIEKFKVKRYE